MALGGERGRAVGVKAQVAVCTASRLSWVQAHQSMNGARRPEAPAWRWEASEDAQWAYGAFFALLAAGQVPALQALRLADLPYFMGLATLTIYIGAHRGLASKARQQISLRQARSMQPHAHLAHLLLKWL